MLVDYDEVLDFMNEYGLKNIKEFKAILALAGKEHTKLYESFESDVKEEKDFFELVVSMRGTGEYVQNGTEPGNTPNYKDIVDWIDRVKSISKFSWMKDFNKYGLAFSISDNIYENGIDEVDFMKPWSDNLNGFIEGMRILFTKLTTSEIHSQVSELFNRETTSF